MTVLVLTEIMNWGHVSHGYKYVLQEIITSKTADKNENNKGLSLYLWWNATKKGDIPNA